MDQTRSYLENALVAHKTLVRNCLDLALPEPLVRVENFTSFGRVTVMRQEERRIVYLLNYLPELRGNKFQVIEEPILSLDVVVGLRLDGFNPTRVYLAPSDTDLSYRVENGYAYANIPEVKGYQMVVFE